MSAAVVYKLLAIVAAVGLGWVAGRLRWLEGGTSSAEASRLLGNAAFYLFVPALLFRTTARLDLSTMPWRMVLAFFGPALLFLLAVYLWQRRRAPRGQAAAVPAVRALGASFGNSVQLGIPFAAAVFGEPGLALHIALISVHALVLLSLPTVLVELDLQRERSAAGAGSPLAVVLQQTVRNTVVHPVVLPVLAGLMWNLTGLGLHAVVDEVLLTLATAVVPLCLVLIGLTLERYGLRGHWQRALPLAALKLLALPALVLGVARWGFGLAGLPLAVLVVLAALPVGSNPLIFAQRYAALEAETTAAIVISTLAFVATAWLWLAVLAWLA